jgi:glycosyltransferase involved in cell wall biosynthesis
VRFIAVGAGPLRSRLSRFFVRRALRLSDHRSYRDEGSRRFVQVLGFPAPGGVCPDLAYALQPLPPQARTGTRPLVSVGPMPFGDPRSWPEKDPTAYQAYLIKLRAFVAWLLQTGHDVALFSSDIHMDDLVVRDVLAGLPAVDVRARGARGVLSAPPIATVAELVSLLARSEVVVASRYHGTLLSHLVHTPVLALGAHPKVWSVMEEAGQSAFWLDLESCSLEDAQSAFTRLAAEADRVRRELAAHTERQRARVHAELNAVIPGPAGASATAPAAARPRPRVALGMPVYNGENYLREALDDILAQTFRDFELVICDNASTDRTGEICREYAARDPRIRYVRNSSNIGGSPNFNRVFALSDGEYYAWVAHDDRRAPTYLERCVAVLDREPDVSVCFTGTRDIDERGQPLPTAPFTLPTDRPRARDRFRALIRLDHKLEPIYGLFRTDVLRRGPLEGSYADSDRVLLAETALAGPFRQVPAELFYRRIHALQSINVFPGRQARTAWFDPDGAGKLVFPHFRQAVEYARSIGRARLSRGERLGCYGALSGWLWTNRARLLSDLDYGARHLVRPLVRRLRRPRPPQRPAGQPAAEGAK